MTHTDGIYFNMPEDEYHAIERLSSSGIQNMLVSPATFWAKSWLNKDRKETEKKHQEVGRAYHCARLEPERFAAEYVREISKADYPDALTTDVQIKAELKKLGEAQGRAGETVLDRAKRLRDAGYTGQIWHLLADEWENANSKFIGLAADVWDDIEEDAKRIRQCSEVAELITGGVAEVTVLWTDQKTGVAMKARLDYLRPTGYTDFKTFDNSRGVHLNQAIVNAFQYNRYYIQAALYWDVSELLRSGDLPIHNESQATDEQIRVIGACIENPAPMKAWYVMQEKNGVPNILARRFMTHYLQEATKYQAPEGVDMERYAEPTQIYTKARAEIRKAQNTFNLMREIYADGEPWLPIRPMGTIEDADFSPYFLESEI